MCVILQGDIMALSYSFTDFCNQHSNQLHHFKVPSSLWNTIYSKLTSQIFDAGEYVMFSQEDGVVPHMSLVTSNSLVKEGNVFLIDHAWYDDENKVFLCGKN